MATRRKITEDPAKKARRQARLVLGSPPSEKVIVPKRLRPPKHKKPLSDQD
jgi:hypothetical protein